MVRSLAVGLLLLALLAPVALAQSVTISAAYPAVVIDPGGTATFPLAVTTPAPERVDLLVVAAPPDWTTRIRGGGAIISAVQTGGDPAPEVTLEVSAPEDAAPGSYQVVIEARSATAASRLDIDLTVEAAEEGAVSLTAQYPVQVRSAGQTAQFDLTLRNDTNQEHTFSLETEGPAGWRVEAHPAGEESAATAVVAAGATARITVEATSPDNANAGQYPLVVRAVGGPQPAEHLLGVEITGTYGLELITADDRLNARVTVGSSSPLTLIVTNTGSAPLAAVNLSATPPTGWQVDFDRPVIENLAPGLENSQTVTATIRAADNAVAGDYALTVRAAATEQAGSASDSIEVRTTVETSPLWGFVGLAVIALVLAGLFLVFRQYGRR
ncbi:MAG: NEW3 domain-containing protein [Chloroflexota bacterium]|nr:NEW3 domain-containing protein [Chloroflexota bacterium]